MKNVQNAKPSKVWYAKGGRWLLLFLPWLFGILAGYVIVVIAVIITILTRHPCHYLEHCRP